MLVICELADIRNIGRSKRFIVNINLNVVSDGYRVDEGIGDSGAFGVKSRGRCPRLARAVLLRTLPSLDSCPNSGKSLTFVTSTMTSDGVAVARGVGGSISVTWYCRCALKVQVSLDSQHDRQPLSVAR